jgi:hypothetical protein
MTTTHDYWRAHLASEKMLEELEWHPLDVKVADYICKTCDHRHTHYTCPVCGKKVTNMDFDITELGWVWTFNSCIVNMCWHCDSNHLISLGVPRSGTCDGKFYIAYSPKEPE